MDPAHVLYALCGLVGLAIAIFIIMSIVSLLRRPQLPDLASLELGQAALTIAPLAPIAPHPPLSLEKVRDNFMDVQATTPFQRAVRALTPVPWLPKLGPAPVARIDITKVPHLPQTTPLAPSQPVPRSVVVAPIPSLTPKPEILAKPSVAPAAPRKRVRLPTPPVMFASWSARFPRKRRRGRIVLVALALLVACSGALVAAPHMIDPLCDDYEWFGDSAAQSVRHVAVDAHDAIASLIS